ncbi:hypothetical protein [Nocardioides dokdonensis]|uniref:hypothetical protein n=1 Tax=Nocardioides dokdonensis TaxID=450734 RepID=UPI00083080E3|nr:hypothetical protein [Nocardioides dokdonensis]
MDEPVLDPEERLRRAGHVILDGVVAAEADPDLVPCGTNPVELAFGHLLEIGAVELMMDDESEELELDISPLMGGVMLVVRRLVAELAARDGVDPETVVMSVRAAIDQAAG